MSDHLAYCSSHKPDLFHFVRSLRQHRKRSVVQTYLNLQQLEEKFAQEYQFLWIGLFYSASNQENLPVQPKHHPVENW